ncbi:MAG TPA: hypothetical protein VLG76_01530 [Rhabdochlamydiaceae bacterium]|nr:hypothetical protein [Rhabdochlamydiaceae bacterium]
MPPIYAKETITRSEHEQTRTQFSIYPGQRIINQVETDALSMWDKVNPFSTIPSDLEMSQKQIVFYNRLAQKITEKINAINEEIKSTSTTSQERVDLASELETDLVSLQDAAAKGHRAAQKALDLAQKRAKQWGIAGICNVL